jgi:hypothetical protein
MTVYSRTTDDALMPWRSHLNVVRENRESEWDDNRRTILWNSVHERADALARETPLSLDKLKENATNLS